MVQRFLAEAFSTSLCGAQPHNDIVNEIGRDEARHGKGFEGLLKRYFGGKKTVRKGQTAVCPFSAGDRQ